MFWHLKYRTTTENHDNTSYPIKEEDLMKEYTNRHKDEDILELLTQIRSSMTYSCSDPRMHQRAEGVCQKYTKLSLERHEKDFTDLEELISDYITDDGCIPYCTVLHLLAMRYLGAGLVTPDDFDMDHPYRIPPLISEKHPKKYHVVYSVYRDGI